jgi:phosphatidylserine/phosphatidylglycerophosphate/cardiolipin synthase-like enzyme
MAVYELNLTPIAEALVAAKQRGVRVRVITDDEGGIAADSQADGGQFRLLKRAKVEVKADTRRALMHHKFVIIDGRMVWTGSTNLTVNDNFRNNNNVIIIRSPELAAIYTSQFEEMWGGQFSRGPSNPDAQTVTLGDTPIQVLFSPEDKAMSYVVSLVESAERSIRFMAFSFTDDALTDAMLSRAKAGVSVQGIIESRGSETIYGALRPLFCAGLPVRQDGNKYTFHHKVIVVDGSIVVTGSFNFSANANNDNNENMLILENPQIAALYLQEFDRRWAEAPPKPDISCP